MSVDILRFVPCGQNVVRERAEHHQKERPLTTCYHRLPASTVVDVFHVPDAVVRPRVSAMLRAMLLCVLVLVDIHVVAALGPVGC